MKDIKYALMLIKAHKFDGAKDVLEELLQRDPGNQDILYNLGMCYTELDEPEKAVETLSECVRYYPHYSNAYVALGFACSRLTDDEKAKDNFLRAIEIEPSNPYALRNLGGLYGKENDYEKAIQCLEKSFSINPEVLSKTSYESLKKDRTAAESKEEFKANHVLFLEDQRDWPVELFQKIFV